MEISESFQVESEFKMNGLIHVAPKMTRNGCGVLLDCWVDVCWVRVNIIVFPNI